MRQHSEQLYVQDVKGTPQAHKCRDVLFLLLFLFHLVGLLYLWNTYGWQAISDGTPTGHYAGDKEVTVYYINLLYLTALSGAFAMLVSALALLLMTVIARRFVQVALIIVSTLSFAWGTIGIGLSPKSVVPITGFIALALSIAYALIVWERIPFAAANLVTALRGVRENPGTLVVAWIFQVLSLGVAVFYTIVVVGVYDAIQRETLSLSPKLVVVVYSALGFSFYWTYHVMLNVIQVTTAGVIGKWWYRPVDGEGYNPGQVVVFAFFKAAFYSLGSICFGSLLVGPVRILRQLSALVRPSSDESTPLLCFHQFLNCIQTCITSCVESLADHFNPWAITYLGSTLALTAMLKARVIARLRMAPDRATAAALLPSRTSLSSG